jgi:hypothetical protein
MRHYRANRDFKGGGQEAARFPQIRATVFHGRRMSAFRVSLAPADAALYSSLREVAAEILDTLTPREAKALRKLRRTTRSDRLRSFVDADH